MASNTPPPTSSSSQHIVISVREFTIYVPTSITAAQQAPLTVVLTSPTCQDPSVRTQDASVDEAQQAATNSQPAQEEV